MKWQVVTLRKQCRTEVIGLLIDRWSVSDALANDPFSKPAINATWNNPTLPNEVAYIWSE